MAENVYTGGAASPRTRFISMAAQFGHPHGLWGNLAGRAMAITNYLPNRVSIDLLDVQPTDDVLELGFGPGRALRRLSGLAFAGSVTGIDRSSAMLTQARLHNRRAIADGRVSLLRGTFEALPLANSSIDKILAVNIAYFISPAGSALAEARRVLRDGGTIVLYATDYSKMRWLQFAGPETYQMFDGSSFAAFLQDSPFHLDDIAVHRFSLPVGFRGLVATITKHAQA